MGSVYVYEQGRAFSADIPLAWRLIQHLPHHHHLLSLSWTASGDGMLTAGTQQVVMWRREDADSGTTRFVQLWQMSTGVANHLAAAAWSADGLSATADVANPGSKLEPQTQTSGLVTVWSYGGGSESTSVTPVGLPHPGEVTAVQWRPQPGEDKLEVHVHAMEPIQNRIVRPVLMTCCVDGTVRLWMEIDGGRVAKDGGETPPPFFFVCAVI